MIIQYVWMRYKKTEVEINYDVNIKVRQKVGQISDRICGSPKDIKDQKSGSLSVSINQILISNSMNIMYSAQYFIKQSTIRIRRKIVTQKLHYKLLRNMSLSRISLRLVCLKYYVKETNSLQSTKRNPTASPGQKFVLKNLLVILLCVAVTAGSRVVQSIRRCSQF